MTIRVIIADQEATTCLALSEGLMLDQEIDVMEQCNNGADALDLVHRLQPDIAIIDVGLPEVSGIDLARELIESNSKTRVIALSLYLDTCSIDEMIEAGMWGYVRKNSALQDLINAVHVVANGETYYERAATALSQ